MKKIRKLVPPAVTVIAKLVLYIGVLLLLGLFGRQAFIWAFDIVPGAIVSWIYVIIVVYSVLYSNINWRRIFDDIGINPVKVFLVVVFAALLVFASIRGWYSFFVPSNINRIVLAIIYGAIIAFYMTYFIASQVFLNLRYHKNWRELKDPLIALAVIILVVFAMFFLPVNSVLVALVQVAIVAIIIAFTTFCYNLHYLLIAIDHTRVGNHKASSNKAAQAEFSEIMKRVNNKYVIAVQAVFVTLLVLFDVSRNIVWAAVVFWVIVGILAFVLAMFLLMLILLAVPIRYSVNGSIGEDGGPQVVANVTYLLKLVQVAFSYSKEGTKLAVKIAGFRVGKKPSEDDETRQDSTKTTGEATVLRLMNIAKKVGVADFKEGSLAHQLTSGLEETPAADEIQQDYIDMPPELEHIKAEPLEEPEDSKKTKTSIKDKLTNLKKDIDGVLQYPNRKIVTKLVIRAIKKTMKLLLPKHMHITGQVGFSDPSTTGFFMAGYAVLYGALNAGHHVQISGIFDTPSTVVKLNGNVKGRINILRITLPTIGLLLKKSIRTLIRDLLKLTKRKED